MLRVKNRYWFSSLADITLKVSVKTDGRQVASYEFKLPHLQPGESGMHLPVLALAGETLIDVAVHKDSATRYSESGQRLGHYQHLRQAAVRLPAPPLADAPALQCREEHHQLIVSGGRFQLAFSLLSGELQSWRIDGEEVWDARRASPSSNR